jgi:hypothetical protein
MDNVILTRTSRLYLRDAVSEGGLRTWSLKRAPAGAGENCQQESPGFLSHDWRFDQQRQQTKPEPPTAVLPLPANPT